jgi:excisionase family DNA binding protein
MSMLRLRSVAARLGVSYRSVQRYVQSGTLPTTRTPGGHHRVNSADLDALIEDTKLDRADGLLRAERFKGKATPAPPADRGVTGR